MVTVRDEFPEPAPAEAGAKVRPPMSRWGDWRVTHYDAKAKPAKEEFSREAFDRVAATMLKPGEAMPEVREELFKSTERLPEVSFIAWADKKPFRLADLQGKVVVLETWASWCHYCKEAFPYYEKMRRQLAAQDVVFVAVSFDAKVADYEKWMNAHGSEYGFKFGRIDAPDARAAMLEFRGSLPAFYVLGRDGRIISGYGGYAYGAGNEDPRLLAALREAGVKL
jgi:thiol-disulfide isomerase/thioredoxin